MKKLFLILILVQLAFTAMAAAWDGTIASGYASGAGTSADPYLISTPQQLAFLANQANAANGNTQAKYFKLTADIDLNNMAWTPIGISGTNYFGGIFDGDNHSITNIYINDATTLFSGLFGYVNGKSSVNAIIKNLTIASGTLTVTNSASCNGAFAGRAQYTQLINCKNKINVKGFNNVGGIVGVLGASTSTCILEYCSNVGTISASGAGLHVGGLVGNSAVNNGKNSISYIRFSFNTGVVSAITNAGGVVGSNSGNLTIQECYNTGNISAVNNAAGGIVGYGYGLLNVLNSYNTGAVKQINSGVPKTSLNAGILGYPGGNAEGKYFSAITNCYNIGMVTAAKTASIAEAIAGALKGGDLTIDGTGTVVNSYYLSTLAVTNSNGGIAKTNDELKLKDFVKILNNSQKPEVWGIDAKINNGFPILKWQISANNSK
jgi:hypothetical protein